LPASRTSFGSRERPCGISFSIGVALSAASWTARAAAIWLLNRLRSPKVAGSALYPASSRIC
jgi:hypothetical protein